MNKFILTLLILLLAGCVSEEVIINEELLIKCNISGRETLFKPCYNKTDCAFLSETALCYNPGTCEAHCADIIINDDNNNSNNLIYCNETGMYVEQQCINDTDCDDNDALTIDYCVSLGSCYTQCSHDCPGIFCYPNNTRTCTVPLCLSDSDCNDNNVLTKDTCVNSWTCNSTCTHTNQTVLTGIDAEDYLNNRGRYSEISSIVSDYCWRDFGSRLSNSRLHIGLPEYNIINNSWHVTCDISYTGTNDKIYHEVYDYYINEDGGTLITYVFNKTY